MGIKNIVIVILVLGMTSFGLNNCFKSFRHTLSKPVYTPLPQGIDFRDINLPEGDNEEEMIDIPYRELIGSLMFAATVSRPNISFTVNKLAQYSSNPTYAHWNLAK